MGRVGSTCLKQKAILTIAVSMMCHHQRCWPIIETAMNPHFLLVKKSPQIVTICCHLNCGSCKKTERFVVACSNICTPSKTSTCLPLGRDIKGAHTISQITQNRHRRDSWVNKTLWGCLMVFFWPQNASSNDIKYALVEKLSSLWQIMDHSLIKLFGLIWSGGVIVLCGILKVGAYVTFSLARYLKFFGN